MTEQQAPNPIDDLFRKTFENLPDTPADSGWDTPSDRVWQHVRTDLSKPVKGGGIQVFVLFILLAAGLAGGLYWMLSRPNEQPPAPAVAVPTEQPVVPPNVSSETPLENQPEVAPKLKTNGTLKESQNKPDPRNNTEAQQGKPASNTAQPLPGSKTTLPPNTTEARKKKGEKID